MKTVTVKLIKKTAGLPDPFGQPTYTEEVIDVSGVLVGEPSSEDVTNAYTMHGAKLAYTLAIPKGDTNNWEDCTVEFFGHKWKTFGFPIQGIEANIPLDWNKKVMVERYE